jgi:hypothetical protein
MKFELNKDVETDKPTVEVDPLPQGQHRFRLVVVDDKKRFSQPAEFVVTVL